LPQGLRPVRPDEGLPARPEVTLLMLKASEPRQPLTDRLAAQIINAVGAHRRKVVTKRSASTDCIYGM
jgi:hypothetical protein